MNIKLQLVRLRTFIRNNTDIDKCIIELKASLMGTNSDLYVLLLVFVSEIEALINDGRYEQAYDFVDAIHALPEIADGKQKNMVQYWNNFIVPYEKKWLTEYFDTYKQQIIDL